jgi:mRNA interferase RelE/StbE
VNTAFRESFGADLSAITDAALLRRIRKVIEKVEAARTFQQIPNLKRLQASGKYYRIRVGDYRIGFVSSAVS